MQGIEDAADRLVQAPAQEEAAQDCAALHCAFPIHWGYREHDADWCGPHLAREDHWNLATMLPLDCVIEVLQGLEGQYIRYCQLYCAFEGALHYSPLLPNALAFNNFVTCDFATASMEIGVAALIPRQMRIALNGIDVGSLANFSRLVGFRQ